MATTCKVGQPLVALLLSQVTRTGTIDEDVSNHYGTSMNRLSNYSKVGQSLVAILLSQATRTDGTFHEDVSYHYGTSMNK